VAGRPGVLERAIVSYCPELQILKFIITFRVYDPWDQVDDQVVNNAGNFYHSL